MTISKTITIFGAGGHAKVVIDALRAKKEFLDIIVYDDTKNKQGFNLLGAKVFTPIPDYFNGMTDIHIAIGNNETRRMLGDKVRSYGCRLYAVIHPRSLIGSCTWFGEGHFVAAGAIIAPGSKLGDGVIVNHQAVVDHDCLIDAWAHIAPGAILGGGVSVGSGTLVGAGAVILPGIKVGKNVIVGAGAVVTRDIVDNSQVIGMPARLREK